MRKNGKVSMGTEEFGNEIYRNFEALYRAVDGLKDALNSLGERVPDDLKEQLEGINQELSEYKSRLGELERWKGDVDVQEMATKLQSFEGNLVRIQQDFQALSAHLSSTDYAGDVQELKKKQGGVYKAVVGTAIAAVLSLGLSIGSYFSKGEVQEPVQRPSASRTVSDPKVMFQHLINYDLYVTDIAETGERSFPSLYSKPKKYVKVKAEVKPDNGMPTLRTTIYVIDTNGDGKTGIETGKKYRITDTDRVFGRVYDGDLSGFVVEEEALKPVD